MRRSAFIATGLLFIVGLGARSAAHAQSAQFQLVIQGTVVATFSEVHGLGSSNDVAVKAAALKALPGVVESVPTSKLQYLPITIRRPIADSYFATWRQIIEKPTSKQTDKAFDRSGSINLLDCNGNVAVEWDFTDAFPSALQIDADATGVFETVVLRVDSLVRSMSNSLCPNP